MKLSLNRNLPGCVVVVVPLLACFQPGDCRVHGRDEEVQDQDGGDDLIQGHREDCNVASYIIGRPKYNLMGLISIRTQCAVL